MEQQTHEMERKWLIPQFTPSMIPSTSRNSRITQTYLEISGLSDTECRVRKEVSDDQKTVFTYTQKSKTDNPAVRIAPEHEITQDEYLEYVADNSKPSYEHITKTRCKIPDGDGVLELDVFDEYLLGLVIMEREFSSVEEMEAYILPEYFGGIEVTNDKRYSNASLSRYGMPYDD